MPTHGSLTKAGKVRSQNPRTVLHKKGSPVPRVKRKRDYYIKVTLENKYGNKSKKKRRRRR